MRHVLAATTVLPLLLALLASCVSIVPGSANAGAQRQQRGPAGAVVAGLEQFYNQPIDWEECASYAKSDIARMLYISPAQCARLTVPLDYAKPDGKTISIALLRIPATGERIGSLIVNPGGPGASGMEMAASLSVGRKNNELNSRFDIVGFDPRGVGASEPTVRCFTDAERDNDRLDNDVDSSAAGIAQTEAENKAYADKCAANTGPDVLANIGTRDVVKDLDIMRSTLGEVRLNYLGYSYGTYIGTKYAQAFPKNVRALVLDGAVDPAENPVDSLVNQGSGFQLAFDKFVENCVKISDCPLGTDPTKANLRFRELTVPLITQQIAVGTRKLSYSDAITATIQAMYSTQLWPQLQDALTGLAKGRGNGLLELADRYYGRDPDGNYSTIMDAFTAIQCVDEPKITDRALIDEAAKRFKEAAPFLDDGQPAIGALTPCAFWPAPHTSEPNAALPNLRQQGLPEVLVISTTGDPATPYQSGVNLAKALGGRLLTYEGNQHTAYLQGISCVDTAATNYLVSLQLPEDGKQCKLR